MPIPGNLLSATTESVDPNTSGWTPKLNCTLLLGAGGRNGPGSLNVRSVAAGEMQARTVSSYTVTAGTTVPREFKPLSPDHRILITAGATAPTELIIQLTLLYAPNYGG